MQKQSLHVKRSPMKRLASATGLLPVVRKLRNGAAHRGFKPAQVRNPMVTIVVPIYNVEDYLEDCVRSLLGQTYPHFEVILVDDGATDSSGAIARRLAHQHAVRIRYIHQENQGLGAARNTGVANARGMYLMFLDSDDTLPQRSVEAMVGAITTTGSDFCCGAMQRVENGAIRIPKWTSELHGQDDLRTTIHERPDMILDVFATNKIYSVEFWKRQGLSFPVGVYYEDQVPSVRAYLSARSFDVLSAPVYNWKIRVGDSSITQTTSEMRNLRDRATVTQEVNEILLTDGTPEIRQEWLDRRLLGNDISLYLKDVDWVTDEYYEGIVSWVSSIFSDSDWETGFNAYPMKRLLAWTVVHGTRESVEELRAIERNNAGGLPTVQESGSFKVVVDAESQAVRTAPPRLLELSEKSLALTSSVRQIKWINNDTLMISGWAFIRNIDLNSYSTSIEILLRDTIGAEVGRFPTKPTGRFNVTSRSKNRWINYDDSGFECALRVTRELIEQLNDMEGASVYVRVATAGIVREHQLTRPLVNGGVQAPQASVLEDVLIQPAWRNSGLTLSQCRDFSTATSITTIGEEVELEITSSGPIESITYGRYETWTSSVPATAPGQDRGRNYTSLVRIPLDVVDHSRSRKVQITINGTQVPLRAGADIEQIQPLDTLVAAYRTVQGTLLLGKRVPKMVINDFQDERLGLSISGCYDGVDINSLALSGARSDLPPSTLQIDTIQRTFRATFKLVAPDWEGNDLPIPIGVYRPTVLTPDGIRAQIRWCSESLTKVPMERERSSHSIRSTRRHEPIIEILADTGPGSHGQYMQRVLQEEVYDLARSGPREDSVLFESFQGRNITCNPRAIWQELVDRGSSLKMYWSVNDHSVSVPDGTTPLIRLSREWYRVLGSAKYLVNNSNFPALFRQAEDQVYIQTWHGTPLKKIGHDIGRVLFSYRNYLELMDREAAGWSTLLSPSKFCNEVFPHAFAYDGDVYESGYPRNDVLLNNPEQAAGRARKLLGLENDTRKVLLYAPTWRDDQFVGRPGRYQSVYHLDFEAFARDLGDEYLIAVRGHSNTLLYGTGVRGDGVIDVTRYPEVADLYALADVLVTDYSSVMFDYSVTGKPLLFLAPDIADYRDRVRGFYFDFEATSPGPILSTTSELISEVQQISQMQLAYKERYAAFQARYNSAEDGRAAARVVDRFFELTPAIER